MQLQKQLLRGSIPNAARHSPRHQRRHLAQSLDEQLEPPFNVIGIPSTGSACIQWTRPNTMDAVRITEYRIYLRTASPNAAVPQDYAVFSLTPLPPASLADEAPLGVKVKNLKNNVAYAFSISARDGTGRQSVESFSVEITPVSWYPPCSSDYEIQNGSPPPPLPPPTIVAAEPPAPMTPTKSSEDDYDDYGDYGDYSTNDNWASLAPQGVMLEEGDRGVCLSWESIDGSMKLPGGDDEAISYRIYVDTSTQELEIDVPASSGTAFAVGFLSNGNEHKVELVAISSIYGTSSRSKPVYGTPGESKYCEMISDYDYKADPIGEEYFFEYKSPSASD